MLKLTRSSLEWALKQALEHGDTDIFPPAFEFQAINHRKDAIFQWIEGEDILQWNVRASRRCITPKHLYGFRISTQLDPVDFLIFTALVYEIGSDLERRRVAKNEGIVHSFRFDPKPDGDMYDKSVGYESFVHRSQELADDNVSWVILTDIADFYPRLYHHRIKNALSSCTTKQNHVIGIDRLMSAWNESYSYGIPVGCAASRLLAEVALDDVDRSLLSDGKKFVRFSDDFRIFCKNKRDAYETLAFLATVLFENHGLTLGQSKTRVIPVDTFQEQYLLAEKGVELNSLAERFRKILSDLDLESSSQEIEWQDLTREQKREIAKLNLQEILEEQVNLEEIDIPITRFVLRRLRQIGNQGSLELILNSMDKLYPVVPDVVHYLNSLHGLDDEASKEIGSQVLNILHDSTASHLEFHRMWLLSIFANSRDFNNIDQFTNLFSTWSDHFSQREVILALGHSQNDAWFRMRKRNVFDFGPWPRRALLLAGSCLPRDERRHWYQSLEPRLDQLEVAITAWARQHPF